jgi:ParB/RepB/Spo0J family partition protein
VSGILHGADRSTLVRLSDLSANPDNPRATLGDVDELAASIVVLGLLQPLLVVELPAGGFMVVDGHRRHAAMASIGYDEPIPVIVTQMDREERIVAALAAGSFARPLSPIDQAKAFQQLTSMGLTQTQISERSGVHQVTVSSRLKLLLLSDEQQQAVHEGRMTLAQARIAGMEIKKRPRSRKEPARRGGYEGRSCAECGQPIPKGSGGEPRSVLPLVLACDDCDQQFHTADAPKLHRHTMEVHGRRPSTAERTPTRVGVAA